MNPTGTFLYLIASLVLGITQLVEAIALWKRNGRLATVMLTFTKVEVVWAAVSLFIWREIDVPAWFPLSFTAYIATFTVVGFILKKQIETNGVPPALIIPGGVFGLYFLVGASAYLAAS